MPTEQPNKKVTKHLALIAATSSLAQSRPVWFEKLALALENLGLFFRQFLYVGQMSRAASPVVVDPDISGRRGKKA